jgi:hypothetical protein
MIRLMCKYEANMIWDLRQQEKDNNNVIDLKSIFCDEKTSENCVQL